MPQLLVVVVLVLSPIALLAQYPVECLGSHRTCCPDACNARENRGTCMDVSEARKSGAIRCGMPLINRWDYMCICEPGFEGSACERCVPGLTGESCDQPVPEHELKHRRSLLELDTDEWSQYSAALRRMKVKVDLRYQSVMYGQDTIYFSSQFDVLSLAHQYALHNEQQVNYAHGGPAFVTWHRRMLLDFERLLEDNGWPYGIPYWDWTQPERLEEFFGPMRGTVSSGPFANFSIVGAELFTNPPPGEDCPRVIPPEHRERGVIWRDQNMCDTPFPKTEQVLDVLEMPLFDCFPYNMRSACGFRNFLEGFAPFTQNRSLHNALHVAIGGAMRVIDIAASDPLFYSHHAFVDMLFERGMRRHGWVEADYPYVDSPGQDPNPDFPPGQQGGECMAPLTPTGPNVGMMRPAIQLGYTYDSPLQRQGLQAFQDGEELRDETLTRIKDGMPPIPRCKRTVIVGAGISGLMSAYELRRAGCKDIVVLESESRFGGRLDTALSAASFPPRGEQVSFLEAGAMRFPANHWATFSYARRLNMTDPFITMIQSNPEGLVSLKCLEKPVPHRVLNPKDPSFRPAVLDRIFECFKITDPGEKYPPDILMDRAFAPYVNMLDEGMRSGPDGLYKAFQEVNRRLDRFSTYSFLQHHGYSDHAIDMIGLVLGLDPLIHVNVIEIFRDVVSQWWNDNLETNYPDTPLYEGLKKGGIWQFREGSSSFAQAFFDRVSEFVQFGSKVYEIQQVEKLESLHDKRSRSASSSKAELLGKGRGGGGLRFKRMPQSVAAADFESGVEDINSLTPRCQQLLRTRYMLANSHKPGCRVEDSDVVLVRFSKQGGTIQDCIEAEAVIVTVTNSVLKTIKFDPPLSNGRQRALQRSFNVDAAKILVQLRDRTPIVQGSPRTAPEDEHLGVVDGSGGKTITDTPFGSLYYDTHPWKTTNRTTIMFYTWGANAGIIGATERHQLFRAVHETVSAMHGEEAAKAIELVEPITWGSQARSKSGFLLYMPGQWSMQPPSPGMDGRIFFAGDGRSPHFHGWVQGALVSSWAALKALYQSSIFAVDGVEPFPWYEP